MARFVWAHNGPDQERIYRNQDDEAHDMVYERFGLRIKDSGLLAGTLSDHIRSTSTSTTSKSIDHSAHVITKRIKHRASATGFDVFNILRTTLVVRP